MKKLRLIKPWRLQAQRQKLITGIPGAIPEGGITVNTGHQETDARTGKAFDGRAEKREQAPAPGAIFVPGNNARD